MIRNKELKLEAIRYFLNNVLDTKYSIEERKKELLRVFSKLNGFPEMSDIWGSELTAIDDISISEMKALLDEVE